MQKVKISIVIGTRPEIIRIAPILQELQKISDKAEVELLHTGQHYSDNMSKDIFEDLNVKAKIIGLKKRKPYEQMAEMTQKLGSYYTRNRPDIVCVWGDTNSSLIGAMVANKLGVKVCHLEAGCRSFDRRMPEEHNRLMIDVISDLLIPLSFNDRGNLEAERMQGEIQWTGDPLYDIFLKEVKQLGLKVGEVSNPTVLITLHRAENTDKKETLTTLFRSLAAIKDYELVFPIHPRTVKMAKKYGIIDILKKPNIKLLKPITYHELLEYLVTCSLVITDSGGLQKEAFYAEKPCITARRSTEWVDTQTLGVNAVLDPEAKTFKTKFAKAVKDAPKTQKKFAKISESPYGDGKASRKVARLIVKKAAQDMNG